MDALTLAANHFSPHGDSFWRWSADAEAIEWADSTAIAFYDEVFAVVEMLGARPLPPFQAIVMMLAACQYNWQSASRFQIIIGYTQQLDQAQLRSRLSGDWQHDLLVKLDSIHALLSEQQGTTEFKKTVADRLFENRSSSYHFQNTSQLLEQLKKGIPSLLLSEPGDENSVSDRTDLFIACVRAIVGGDLAEDVEEVQTRIDTGLSNIPEPAEFENDPELPDVERMRRLLNHLATTGEELAGIARVAQDLMAAVHLPRAIAEPDLLPLGGFSDISNRGPLDRLLITELAHDDETLSVRVALNEALYLRRESPPKTPQRRRAILVDTGIRLWGVPRVFATSVALALAATAEKLAAISAYRTEGEGIAASDFLTREGLVDHLAALNPNPQPAAATIEFIDLWDGVIDGVDPVLVTHANVLTDAKFRRQLRERLSDEPVYIATVDGDGNYELCAFSAAGQRRLQSARIDLGKLLGATGGDSDTSELLDADIDPELPAIFSMRPFPLRVPLQFEPNRSLYVEGVGVLSHSRDGRLHLWDRKRCGARLLTSQLPRGMVVWCHLDAEERLAYVLVQGDGLTLLTSDLDEGGSVRHVLREQLPEATGKKKGGYTFCHHRSSLFFVYEETAEMYSLHDGRGCGSLELPHSVRTNYGRFFRFGGEWFALCGELTPVLEKIHPKGETVGAVFESPLLASPVAVTKEGAILELGGDTPLAIGNFQGGPSLMNFALSDDGTRIGTQLAAQHFIFDLRDRSVTGYPISVDLDRRLNLEKYEIASYNPTPHIKFNSIDLSSTGRILLVTPKGITHVIELKGAEIVLRPLAVKDREGYNPIMFEEIEPPGRARFKLQRAVWPCGSRALLDARGFLHIKHCGTDLAEITFALRDGMLSGWTSDNAYFGQNFYLEPHRAQSAAAVYVTLEKITARILAAEDANPQ